MIIYSPETMLEYYNAKKDFLFKYSGPILQKRTSTEAFIDKINATFEGVKRYNIHDDIILEHPKFFVVINKDGGSFDINGYADSLEVLEQLSKNGKMILETETVGINVMSYDFYLDNRIGVTFDSSYIVMEKMPSKLYVPYIDVDVLFEQFFKSSENILLLTGKSGIGKSKLGALAIDYLGKHTEKVDANIATASDVNVLSNESFWNALIGEEIDLVVLDDLDFLLTPRTEEQGFNDNAKNRFISNFLSFTDGFKKNNVKFIITTNQSVDTIDKSLLRKGRMFDILQLRELTNAEAKAIWDNEVKDKPFTLKGPVLACDLAHAIEETNVRVYTKDYLLDKSVSLLNTTTKTLGF